MTDTVSCLGAFALELSPQTRALSPQLPQAQAAELAALLARDLARWVPEVRDCDFTVLAALFDPNAAKGKGRVNIPVNAVSQSFVMISEWFHSI